MKPIYLNLDLLTKKTRKKIFLEELEKVVPWADVEALIAPYYCEGVKGRPPFALQTMLRTLFMQQWFTLSDPAMEEAFVDSPLYRQFAGIEEFTRLPDKSTILRLHHRLEKLRLSEQMLATVNGIMQAKGLLLKHGTVVDATLIAAPSSTKNKDHGRDPEMHSSKKGEQMYFGMKAHIDADAMPGLLHTVRGTSGNVHHIVEGNSLLHGEETVAFGDAGYQGIEKRPEAKPDATWHIAMRPGKRKALNKDNEADALIGKAEKLKTRCPRQSGASISGDQTPVRFHESALPWAQEEHAATVYLVRVVQFVDGARQVYGDAGMSAPENRGLHVKAGEDSLKWVEKCRNLAGFLGKPPI